MIKKRMLILLIILAVVSIVGIIFSFSSYGKQKIATIQQKIMPKKSTPAVKKLDWNKEKQALVFAAQGDKIAYKVKQDDDRWTVIYDGQESSAYDSIDNPVFSVDGTQFAFTGMIADQGFVILNITQEIAAYNGATSVIFTPNGNQIAFVAQKNGEVVVIINGQESKVYQDIAYIQNKDGSQSQLIVSQDGTKIVYQAEENGKTFIVVNGQEGKKYDEITNVVISADGTITYDAKIGDKEVTVVNGKETPKTDDNSGTPADTGNTPVTIDNGSNTDRSKRKGTSGIKDEDFDYGRIQYTICTEAEKQSNQCNN